MKQLYKFFSVLALMTTAFNVVAKQAPNRAYKQILPEKQVSKKASLAESHVIAKGIKSQPNFKLQGSLDAEQIAQQYIQHFMAKQQHPLAKDVAFTITGIHQGARITTVRFKQTHANSDVYGGQFTVSINLNGQVVFATQQVFAVEALASSKRRVDQDQAWSVVNDFFKHDKAKTAKAQADSTSELVIYPEAGQARWVYQVEYNFDAGRQHWQLLVDADSGQLVRAADQLHYENAPATVFDPDPLSSSGQVYGGGYVDGNDQDTPQLNQQLKAVTLDVTNQNGTFLLTNEWAESVDVDGPFDGNFSQNSNDFTYHRGQDSFEAVNVFYHLSEYLDYLNNDLGLNVRPYQYTSGIRFDAHGDDGADNSFYNSSGLLVFGEGCVDDAEDADVVIHELGHGIHDWITLGGLSQVNGLSEGTGDYFAQSYSRSRPGFQWEPGDAHYNHVFSWDGHNTCWNGRTTDYNRTYPSGLVQQIHTDGQIWSTCLMQVWDELGAEKTDSMVVEGLSMTNNTTNQAEAAQAVLQAAAELGYSNDLNTIADTFNACGYQVESINQFNVTINPSTTTPVMGSAVTFTAAVSGGTGPFTYQWDINGDGVTDGTGENMVGTYSQAYQGSVTLAVQDANDSTGAANLSVNIAGPNIELLDVDNIRANLNQVCGNNDDVVDPGERWSSVLEAKNTGNRTATEVYLAMAKNRNNTATPSVGDSYGNSVAACNRSFIDISNSGTLLSWQAAGTQFPANDEGSVLIQLGQQIDHYGSSVGQLRASTNGYFSTSSASNGLDFDQDCPLPATPNADQTGGRIAPMHSDLKDAEFYHQSFSSCPRSAETGGDLACEVFLWQGADFWDTTSTVENVDVQAILYPATSQWVFQYGGTGFDGSDSTIGMQNTAANDGLTFACNTAGSINTQTAVCVYNKNHQPAAQDTSWWSLENPAIALNSMAVDASQTADLNFAIAEDAPCGGSIGINHEASVFNKGFNVGQNSVLNHQLGNNGVCNVVTSCGVGTTAERSGKNDLTPQNGLWWNPLRSGNGVDLHVTEQSALLYVMYTGNPDRTPIWYIANNADSSHNQYYNDILEVSFPGGFATGNQQVETVGYSNTSFINATAAIQVRNIKGQLSAEQLVVDQFAASPTPNMHTGHYFSPNESGWGQSVITLGTTRVVISYIYDVSGEPFWTIASGSNDSGEKTVVYADTFCPHCPAIPIDVATVGTMSMQFNGQVDGVIEGYNIAYPPGGETPEAYWETSNLPIVNLVPPNN